MQKILILLAVTLFMAQVHSQCTTGTYASGLSCLNCGQGAATCNGANVYQSCAAGFFASTISSTSVGCNYCQNPSGSQNAATCSSGVNALSCNMGYYLLAGLCIPCNSVQASVYATVACQSTCSMSGLYTVGTTCLSCASTTASCNAACPTQGYVTVGNTCVSCPVGALTCSSLSVTTSCQTGYQLSAGALCLLCANGQASCSNQMVATSCANMYYLLSTNTCAACSAQPLAASCNSACTQGQGWYSVGATCVQCVTSITAACNSACTSQGFTTVTTTTAGVSSSTCVACASGALICSSATVSTQCSSSYYLAASGVCQSCSNQMTTNQLNQVSCSSNVNPLTCSLGYAIVATTCTACASTTAACVTGCTTNGFYTINSTCVSCGTGVTVCTTSTNATSCSTGYYLSGLVCVQVSTGTTVSGQPSTVTVLTGYYQTTATVNSVIVNVALPCMPGASSCSAPVITNIPATYPASTACSSGFNLYQGTCVKCPANSATCNSPQPIACNVNYALINNACTACSALTGVYCSGTQSTNHIGCSSGYYLNSLNTCTACASNTAQCTSLAGTVCTVGYFVVIPYTTSACNVGVGNIAIGSQYATNIGSACASNFVIVNPNTATTSCQQCGQNALTCTAAVALSASVVGLPTQNQNCQSGFQLNNNFCNPCTSGANTCSSSLYVVATLTSCNTGYYISAITACSLCSSSTLTVTGGAAIVGQAYILSCASNAPTSYTVINTITCINGYVAAKTDSASSTALVTSVTIVGCYSCSGSTTVTGYSTCTLPQTAYGASTSTPTANLCQVGSLVTPSAAAVAGYYASSATLCNACISSSLTTNSGAALMGPTFIQGCKTAGTDNKVTDILCMAGYAPAPNTGGTVAAGTQVLQNMPVVSGCYSCSGSAAVTGYSSCTQPIIPYGGSGGPYVITAVVCQVGSLVTPSAAAVAGYYASSATICNACISNSLTTTSGVALMGSTFIQGCKTGGTDNKVTDILCMAGYAPAPNTGTVAAGTQVLQNMPAVSGCYSCSGSAAVTGYSSCTQAVIPYGGGSASVSIVVCSIGYYRSSDQQCQACNVAALLKAGDGSANIVGLSVVTACVSHTDFITIKQITCPTGYVALLQTGSSTTNLYSTTTSYIVGCQSCSGTAIVTGYTTCTSVATAYGTQGVISAVVCASGYVNINAAGNICAQSSSIVANSLATVSNMQGVTCNSGYYLSAANVCTTCTIGATSAGTVTLGVATCSIVSSNLTPLTCATNYVFIQWSSTCVICDSTTAGSTSSCSATSSWTSACSSGYQAAGGQCTACPLGAATCTTGPIPSTCSNGYFLTVGTCVACTGTGAATCSAAAVTLTCLSSYFSTTANNAVTCTLCSTGASGCTSASAAQGCISGYFLNSAASPQCVACSSNGLTCTGSLTQTTVSLCSSGWYPSANQCVPCAVGAATCTAVGNGAIGTSLTPMNGFYLAAGSTSGLNPYPCGVNVATCTSYSVPLTCNSGFFFTSATATASANCLTACPANAILCTALNVASSCLSGYVLINGFCIACTTGAATCSNSWYPTSNLAGYWCTGGSCSTCGTGANVCASATTATSCLSAGTTLGYFGPSITGTLGLCTACAVGTTTCTSLTAATACVSGYSPISSICTQCTTTGATACTTSASVPTACGTGYSLLTISPSATATCVQCPTNGATCTSTTAVTTCQSGFVPNAAGTACLACTAGSATCTAPVASTCSTGYVVVSGACVACLSSTAQCATGCSTIGFTSVSTTCVACSTGATACSSAIVATICGMGYYGPTSANVCVQCSTGATVCSATAITTCNSVGYFQSGSPVTCANCGTGANLCASASTATNCLTGYYLNALSVCVACANTNALTCGIQGFATSCAANYYVNSGTCSLCSSTTLACVSACLTLGFYTVTTTSSLNVTSSTCNACAAGGSACQSATLSTACLQGYYLNGQATCTACASNTLLCPLQTTIGLCANGYSLISGACVQCPLNFATCSTATNGTTCTNGFYLSTPWTTCSQCPTGSAICQSATVSNYCANLYYPTPVTGNTVTCTLCPTTNNMVNCYSATYATSCQPGYYALSGSCQACASNAATCNGVIILTCNAGYYVNGASSCLACGNGAATCSSNTVALTCLSTFGLVGSSCVQCGQGASSCSSASVATSCLSGFNLASGSCTCPSGQAANSAGSACVSCSSNCATCSSASVCTSCSTPYSLVSGACSFTCTSGNYLNTTTSCATCSKSCATCTAAATCQTCSTGFTLQSSSSSCNANFAGKLQVQNIIMMIALFLGLAFIIKQ